MSSASMDIARADKEAKKKKVKEHIQQLIKWRNQYIGYGHIIDMELFKYINETDSPLEIKHPHYDTD